MITEIVKFKPLESTSDIQLISIADSMVNGLQKNQDGFIDTELVKDLDGTSWCFIFHYENMDEVKASGEKLRSSEIFWDFNKLIEPGSIVVTFYEQQKQYL